jgi:hypothetical protein
MKAQLKELAIQAKLPGYLLEYGTELCVAPHLEKFAELIIRKCANIAKNGTGDDDERHCCTDTRSDVARTIRKEFDIK